MILGYTLATFPKVATYIFMHNPRRNKDLWHNCKNKDLTLYARKWDLAGLVKFKFKCNNRIISKTKTKGGLINWPMVAQTVNID